MEKGSRPGFSIGFGLTGLVGAGLSYLAFDYGLFSGPVWRNVLAAVAIGGGSAALMLGLDRLLFGRSDGERPASKPAKLKGPWGCPRCGSAYVEQAKICSDCRIPLVRRDEAK